MLRGMVACRTKRSGFRCAFVAARDRDLSVNDRLSTILTRG